MNYIALMRAASSAATPCSTHITFFADEGGILNGKDTTGTSRRYATADRTVEAVTDGSGSPNLLTAAETNGIFTNEGATAEAYNVLPTAAANLIYTFVVLDTDGLRVVANTGDTIRDAATESATAGYIRSSTIGDAITLAALNDTQWVVISKIGTWTVDS